jgi:hypothetical protein
MRYTGDTYDSYTRMTYLPDVRIATINWHTNRQNPVCKHVLIPAITNKGDGRDGTVMPKLSLRLQVKETKAIIKIVSITKYVNNSI